MYTERDGVARVVTENRIRKMSVHTLPYYWFNLVRYAPEQCVNHGKSFLVVVDILKRVILSHRIYVNKRVNAQVRDRTHIQVDR